MEATLNKQMDKLLKYLMLLLVTTLSLTFTACGGDEDEPKEPSDNISAQFLVGTWTGEVNEPHSYCVETLKFTKDGDFELICESTYYQKKNQYLLRGKWSIKNNTLYVKYTLYVNGVYDSEREENCRVIFDSYTSTLVFTENSLWHVTHFHRLNE